MSPEEFLKPLDILADDAVYRQAHFSQLIYPPGNKHKRFPKASHFKPDEDGLSVNLCRLITVNGVYHIIGLTYRINKEEFKDPANFKLFTIQTSIITAIDGVVSIIHSPVFKGNPAPIGSPNNYAHTSLIYPDDEEIRLKLSDYCQQDFMHSYCTVDFEIIEKEVSALRERLDDTPYHRLPTKAD